MVVHADSLMRRRLSGKLHGRRSLLLFALYQSSIRQTDIRRESRFLPTPPAFVASVRGSQSEYCHDVFGIEKLEWCGYATVKKIEARFIRFGRVHERDRRTDRRTPHDGIDRACVASRGYLLLSRLKDQMCIGCHG